jgi:MscS family membrane protein
MVDTIIDNISMRTQRKGEVRIEIDLCTSVNQLRHFTQALPEKIMATGAESCTVFLADTGINAHIVQVEYFTPPNEIIEAFNAGKEKINWLILDELAQHQITLAAANNRLTVQMQSPQ